MKKGGRLVTFGSQADKPFVPGVPVGVVSRVDPSGGNLTRTLYVTPYVGFSKLDIVGVVVQAPAKDPRDTVLPDKPKPTPTPTVTVTVTPGAEAPGDGLDQPRAGGSTEPRTEGQNDPQADGLYEPPVYGQNQYEQEQ